MEPAFSSQDQAAAATTTSAIDNKPSWTRTSGSQGLHGSVSTDEAPERRLESSGLEAGVHGERFFPQPEQAGLGSPSSSRRRHPGEAAEASAQRRPVHVAYRHSDLGPVRSQQQAASGGVRGISSSSSSSIAAGGGDDRKLTKREQSEGERLPDGDDHQRSVGTVERRRLSSESKGFRMPAAIENGMGSAWNREPFGPFTACPSSPRVFQIGVAMDTGFFKVLTRLISQKQYLFETVLHPITAFNNVSLPRAQVSQWVSTELG